MQSSRTHPILLVDSHEIFRKGVRYVLDESADIAVVGESDSVEHALTVLEGSTPTVAVVGVREHEREQLELLRPLRRTHPTTKLLVLTRTDDDPTLSAALLAGASGYLSKDVTSQRLIGSVLAVAQGHNLIDPARALRLMRASQEPTELPEDPLRTLTNQERRILALLAEGLSNREIAGQLFLVEKTVRNHVTRVLAKLGVERRTQAALIAARLAHSGGPRSD